MVAQRRGPQGPLGPHDDPPRPATHRPERAGRQARRRRGDQAQRRLGARARRPRRLRAAAARLVASRSSPPPRRCSTAWPSCRAPIRCASTRRCRASSCATPATSSAAAASPTPSPTPATASSAPIGAKLGAKRLVAMAEKLRLQRDARRCPPRRSTRSRRPPSSRTASPSARQRDRPEQGQRHAARDGLGRRHDRQPAAYASSRGWRAGATPRKRVVSAKVAGQVRDMMIAVVTGGTGRAAAIPGVQVAGKTGTAELVSTADIAQNAAQHHRLVRGVRARLQPARGGRRDAARTPARAAPPPPRSPSACCRPRSSASEAHEDRLRQHRADDVLARVDDLGDLEVDDEAAEQVGVLARQAVGRASGGRSSPASRPARRRRGRRRRRWCRRTSRS